MTGCNVVLPNESEAVLLGASMLGAVASGTYPSIRAAMTGMSGVGAEIEPAGEDVAAYHEGKHQVFHRLHDDFLEYREVMTDALTNIQA